MTAVPFTFVLSYTSNNFCCSTVHVDKNRARLIAHLVAFTLAAITTIEVAFCNVQTCRVAREQSEQTNRVLADV